MINAVVEDTLMNKMDDEAYNLIVTLNNFQWSNKYG